MFNYFHHVIGSCKVTKITGSGDLQRKTNSDGGIFLINLHKKKP